MLEVNHNMHPGMNVVADPNKPLASPNDQLAEPNLESSSRNQRAESRNHVRPFPCTDRQNRLPQEEDDESFYVPILFSGPAHQSS